MPGLPQWMWNMLTVLAFDAIDAHVDISAAEILAEADAAVSAMAGGFARGAVLRSSRRAKLLGVVAGVFSSSSGSWCGLRKASKTMPMS